MLYRANGKKMEITIVLVFRVQGILEEVKDLTGVLGYYGGLYQG